MQQDKWEQKLQKALQELKECQAQKQMKSCMKCKEFLECKIRDRYVAAVYESMNRGEGGGFEF